ncbi:hypothetical protein [Paenibacillus alvei]|uniref:hypothetical protein n=1 Tax=Paenibacillus alvei TaxID=44250 RepID=UPI00228265A5|nr:hypothetical protein [Paenibacillus alvei]
MEEKEKEKEKELVHTQDDCHLCTDQQKQLKVLSTSLGVALAANLLMIPFVTGQAIAAQAETPKLTEWSTEEVKAYFDPSADWNIPFVKEEKKVGQTGESVPSSGGSNSASGTTGFNGTVESSQPIVIRDGGFGWDDILLYHMIFNSGRPYSSSSWATSGKVFDTRTNKPYRAKSFSSDSFQNRPVVNSTVRPFTSKGTGTVTRRSSNGSGTDKAKAGSTSVSNGLTSKQQSKNGSGSGTSSKSKTGSNSVSRGSTNNSYRVSGSGSGTSSKSKTGSSSVSRGSTNNSYRVSGSGSVSSSKSKSSSSSSYSSSSSRSSSGYSSSSSRSSSSFGSSKSRSSSVGGIGGRSSGYSSSSRSSSSGGFGG